MLISATSRYTVFLSGSVILTIPKTKQQARLDGGKYGLLIAIDTTERSQDGHISSTGPEELTALQIPTENGRIPSHKVLHQDQCQPSELRY